MAIRIIEEYDSGLPIHHVAKEDLDNSETPCGEEDPCNG